MILTRTVCRQRVNCGKLTGIKLRMSWCWREVEWWCLRISSSGRIIHVSRRTRSFTAAAPEPSISEPRLLNGLVFVANRKKHQNECGMSGSCFLCFLLEIENCIVLIIDWSLSSFRTLMDRVSSCYLFLYMFHLSFVKCTRTVIAPKSISGITSGKYTGTSRRDNYTTVLLHLQMKTSRKRSCLMKKLS